MQNLLATHYALPDSEPKVIEGYTSFKNDEYLYFIILSNDNKAIHMEQTALAYHLFESGYVQTAIPIPNVHGDWTTLYEGKEYIVLQVQMLQRFPSYPHGELLAEFHQMNTTYPYEPELISSYGKWRKLWIDKITVYEEKVKEVAWKTPSIFYEQVMDLLPYIIGISENAIQYMQEMEFEQRYSEVDQATITFQRYENHVVRQLIWMNELTYDHPIRDIAEYIRHQLLQNDERGLEESWLFLKEYETIRPLSPFAWRMLLARLLFPVQFFDLIEKGFSTKNTENINEQLTEMCVKQTVYEQSVRRLYEVIELNNESLQIPMLQWF